MRNKGLRLLLSLAVAAPVALATLNASASPSAVPELVKDVNNGANNVNDVGNPTLFVSGDTAYFSGVSDGGDGLWKSDGTAAGTQLVASATSMGGSSPDKFVQLGSDIYFIVTGTGGSGWQVMKSNGSTVSMVANNASIKAALGASGPDADYQIVSGTDLWAVGGSVYFVALFMTNTPADGTSGPALRYDLFRYNGTTVERATSVEPSNSSDIGPVFELDGVTYAFAYYATPALPSGGSFFITIPASGSPTEIPAKVGSNEFYSPLYSKVAIIPGTPDKAFFSMSSGGNNKITIFDGSVFQVVVDASSNPLTYVGLPTRVGNRVFFTASDNDPANLPTSYDTDTVFYVTPSSATATEIKPSRGFSPSCYQYLGGTGSLDDNIFLFFHAAGASFPKFLELWRSDGTDAGTYKLADTNINANFCNSAAHLYDADTKIYFNTSISESDSTFRFRRSDGTIAGTSDPIAGTDDAYGVTQYTPGDSLVYFFASGTGIGRELFVADPAGTDGSTSTTTASTTTTTTGGGSTTTTSGGGSTTTTSGGTNTTVPDDSVVEALPDGDITDGSSVEPGAKIRLKGPGFVSGERVVGVVAGHGSLIGSGRAGGDGEADIEVTVPEGLSGEQTFALYAPRSGRGYKQVLTISGAEELPPTGSDSRGLALALSVIGAGLVLLVGIRNRSRV